MPEETAEILRQTNFTAFDWGIVVVYLLISLVIGLVVKRYATNMAAYIGAGRSLGTALGVATMTGTELGLVTVMYSAQKGFKGGFSAFHIAVIAGVVTFIVGATGFIVVGLRRRKVLTIPEFYNQRYGRTVRVTGGIMLAFAGILNMGLFLKVGSQFIVGITGLSSEGWALPTVMTGLLTLVLVYTVLGGMISVVITDYVQFVVLSFGMLVTSWIAIDHLGWNRIFETIATLKQDAGFNPLVAEGEFGPEYVLWMCFLGLIGCAAWPTAVARALAMETPEKVKRQYMWSSVSFTIRFMIPYFWGICAFVFIANEAPELQRLFFPSDAQIASGEVAMDNIYALPIFLGRILPAGLIGVISAAMIAAFMSTHDSYLLCWSSVITQDVVAPLMGDRLTTQGRIALTRVLIVAIGIYILAWGLFYTGSDDIWDYMAVTGAIYFTGAIPLLAGGLYWKRASSVGAFCTLIAGFSAILGLSPVRGLASEGIGIVFGEATRERLALEQMTSARIGLITVALTLGVFVVFSLLFPDRNRDDSDSPLSEGVSA